MKNSKSVTIKKKSIIALAVSAILTIPRPFMSTGILLTYPALTSADAITTSVLTPIKAVASGVERADLSPDKTMDKKLDTRWSSAFNDQQWIYYDFGSSTNFSSITINWENSYGTDYEIQTSNDAALWTTIKTVTNGHGGTETMGLSGNGRYLRIKGNKRSSPYGYSIYEVFAYGNANTALTSTIITPIKAFASGIERADLNPDKTLDKNFNTRWASAFNEQQWISYDFGSTINFSSMTINWENAYATQYEIQTSNDAATWTTVKTVAGQGGNETVALTGSGRYLRINGIKRSGAYGYSIYEVSFMGAVNGIGTVATTPTTSTNPMTTSTTSIANTTGTTPTLSTGIINTPSTSSITTPPSTTATTFTGNKVPVNYKNDFINFTKLTTPAPYPANTQTTIPLASVLAPEGYTPLYATGTPVKEVIQYSEPDGTLVTLNGFRAVERHGREWGEDWFLNETDNAANKWNNVDIQSGRHLTFPAFYFQNRTFGLVIRDEVPAGRSRITSYFKANQTKMFNLGIEGFHSMNPLLQGFGWAALGGSMYIPDSTFKTGGEIKAQYCPAEAGLFDCIADMVYLSPYNNDNCDPSWSKCEAKPTIAGFKNPDPIHINKDIHIFSPGDLVEISTAIWLNQDPHFGIPGPDAGGVRYYSQEKLYVSGKGVVPWYAVMPRTNAVPLPDSALSGGGASISYNYSEEPYRLFQQATENIGIANMQRFVEGRRLFHTSFLDGKHSEHPNDNPVFTQHIGQLGNRFNSERCLGCHAMDGRSLAPKVGNMINTLSVLTAATSTTAGINPDPTYGLNVQQLSQDTNAQNFAVKVNAFQTVKTITLTGGDTVELQKPVLGFSGPVPAQYSIRQAPQVIGMGLLEAIDESTILNLADPNDSNGDGVRGTPNWITDPETGAKRLGRFGWKASKGSIRHQVASALMLDMGVTTTVFPAKDCQKNMQSNVCKGGNKNAANVNEADLTKFVDYLSLLAVPAQRSVPSQWEGTNKRIPQIYRDAQPTATSDNRPAIQHGSQLFAQLNCVACHKSELKTGNNHPFAEVRNQLIHPYTDMLLHDMGTGLTDTLTEGNAQPQMWRTQPLWGLGLLPYTSETQEEMDGPDISHGAVSNARYLHDGRARTILEAIEWHDGEAANSRTMFERLSKQERDDLLTFLRTL